MNTLCGSKVVFKCPPQVDPRKLGSNLRAKLIPLPRPQFSPSITPLSVHIRDLKPLKLSHRRALFIMFFKLPRFFIIIFGLLLPCVMAASVEYHCDPKPAEVAPLDIQAGFFYALQKNMCGNVLCKYQSKCKLFQDFGISSVMLDRTYWSRIAIKPGFADCWVGENC